MTPGRRTSREKRCNEAARDNGASSELLAGETSLVTTGCAAFFGTGLSSLSFCTKTN
jgi:hypothetical protein